MNSRSSAVVSSSRFAGGAAKLRDKPVTEDPVDHALDPDAGTPEVSPITQISRCFGLAGRRDADRATPKITGQRSSGLLIVVRRVELHQRAQRNGRSAIRAGNGWPATGEGEFGLLLGAKFRLSRGLRQTLARALLSPHGVD